MFPAMLLVLLVVPETPLPYVICAAVGAVLIWLAHADNIDRLLHGDGAQVRPRRCSRGKRPEPRADPATAVPSLGAAGPANVDTRESIDPGRLTTRVGDHAGSAGRWSARAERMGSAAAHAAEAVAAVDGLAARRAERDLGLAAAVRAGGGEHLARAAIAEP